MNRFKKTYKDGTHEFYDINTDINNAIQIARHNFRANCSLKQIDIYEDSKLIASVYG